MALAPGAGGSSPRKAPPKRPPARPPKGGKGKGKGAGKGKGKPLTIGFNPTKMANTLTNLGYDADLAEIQRQIDMNQGNMASAMQDLQSWANQVEQQHTSGAAASQAAYEQALQEQRANNVNIANLFGGSAGGEAAAYGSVGGDMLSALQASDASFDQRMYPILAAQAQDYQRRARAGFNQDLQELQGSRRDLLKEKGQARAKNLLDLMEMAWARKQDILQYQTAQQALAQSQAMMGLDIQGKKADIAGQNLANTAAAQDIDYKNKANALALKQAQMELRKLAAGGVDWNDPATRSNIGNAAFSGALSPRNTFGINPRVALKNAMIALQQMGLHTNPLAVQAVMNTFKQILNLSHARKQWVKYIIKDGKLVYGPAQKGQSKPPRGRFPHGRH